MTDLTNMPQSEIVIYRNLDNSIQLDVKLDKETVWLSPKQMACLFGKEDSNIRRHIGNIFKEGELQRESHVRFLHIPLFDKLVPYYSFSTKNVPKGEKHPQQ